MASRVSITDVAREAGVSIKTVSNVVNGTGRMRSETREHVISVMRDLGYHVNISARAIRTGGVKLIGLGLANFSQPFASYLADCVIARARELGYGVITSAYGFRSKGIPTIIEETYRLGADGWIFYAERPLEDEGKVLEQPYPVVLVGDYLAYGKADLVTMANVEPLRSVTGRLLDSGLRRIALIGAPDYSGGRIEPESILASREGTGALRVRGYVTAFVERGIPVDWSIVRFAEGWDQFGGREATRLLLEEHGKPEAIVCLNDAMAFGALNELMRRNIQVPQEVQVVGFDNVPDSEFTQPALTTIDPQIADYARHAVDMLIERIEGYSGAARIYTTQYKYIGRVTTR